MALELLCADFMNSEWRDWRGSGASRERLENREWVTEFLIRWGLAPGPDPDTAPLVELIALRQFLRALVKGLELGVQPSDDQIQTLNELMQRAPVQRRLLRTNGEYRLENVPVVRDWDWVMAEIAASFARVLEAGDLRRIKICANESCGWVFYDESRNRARRWCDDRYCGNLLKVRRFRARQKQRETE